MKENFLKKYEEVMGVKLSVKNVVTGSIMVLVFFAALALGELF